MSHPEGPVEPPPRPARRRTGLVVVLVSVLALALVASGVLIVKPGPVAGWLGAGDETTSPGPSEPPPSPVLTAAADDAPMPTAAGVRAAIDDLVGSADLGERVHVSVRDMITGEVLYDHGADVGTVPASAAKLIPAATALVARGPGYRIPTRVVAGEEPGEVVIIGGGDPTLAAGAKGAYPGTARLDELAAQVKKSLGATAVTRVTVDSTLYEGPVYGPGWDDDIPTGGCAGAVTALTVDVAKVDPTATECSTRHREPDLAAGRAFARALGLPDTAVKSVARGKAPAAAGVPTGSGSPSGAGVVPGTELGRVESPPILRLVEFTLLESDAFIAEALARQVALARNQPASFDGASAAMQTVLNELGLADPVTALFDGSGFSRKNRISPALLTSLFTLAANGTRPELAGLFNGLPAAGWSGTLAERYTGQDTTAGAGMVRAKTGTLYGVHALAGVVLTADGRALTFAILADRVPTGDQVVRPALDRISAKLASCGCR